MRQRLWAAKKSRLADADARSTPLAALRTMELRPAVCDLASVLAPDRMLRTLDALHLATFLVARRRIEGLELLIADRRLEDAAGSA